MKENTNEVNILVRSSNFKLTYCIEKRGFMNYVQPIRSKEKIEEMKQELKKNGTRDYLLFIIGINTGLRISDIIKLQVQDILNSDRTLKTHIEITEQKTNKRKRFKLNPIWAEELYQYIKNMDMEDYIFKSRNGVNRPITRVRAYTILNKTARKVGIKDEIGTHTLRKTFGYWFYQRTKDVALLQQIFNHSSPSITLRYIGINQDIVDRELENFSL